MSFRIYERILIAENKWRAVRYGLDGKLIDFGIEEEVPARDLLRELLERVQPISHKLGSWHELEHIHTMLERGSSADQQLAVWRAAGEDLTRVVDFLVQETEKIA
jgi:carboxylate-amine ligase